MAEQFANLAQTTVASGGYTTGSGVLNVTSTASPFPASGTYSLAIADATTGAIKVLLRVSAVNSSTQFAVAAEGADAAASAGDNVYCVLTAASIAQLKTDVGGGGGGGSLGYGALSSIPGSGSTTGSRYKATDTPYSDYVWNGSVWVPFLQGLPCSPPTTSTFGTAADAAGASVITFATQNGCLYYETAYASGTDNISTRVGSVPTAPYTRTMRFQWAYKETGSGSFPWGGMVLRESSSGKVITFGPGRQDASPNNISIAKWNSLTSFSAFYYEQFSYPSGAGAYAGVYHLRINDDNTNLNFQISHDGFNFVTIYSVSRTDFLTGGADGIGVFSLAYSGSGHNMMTVYDYQ